jgi:hypothetical protein
MDLLTLVTACALTVDPKVMHALIWEQSGGEPWSFSVQGQGWPRVFPTLQDAIREAQTSFPSGGRVRVGLTGLSSDARSTTPAMFVPCMNITFAARQIAQQLLKSAWVEFEGGVDPDESIGPVDFELGLLQMVAASRFVATYVDATNRPTWTYTITQ